MIGTEKQNGLISPDLPAGRQVAATILAEIVRKAGTRVTEKSKASASKNKIRFSLKHFLNLFV